MGLSQAAGEGGWTGGSRWLAGIETRDASSDAAIDFLHVSHVSCLVYDKTIMCYAEWAACV
jgi:hypothetical protein